MYVIEYSTLGDFLNGTAAGVWSYYDEADNLYDAKQLEEAARREHPTRKVRMRFISIRRDID